MIHGHSKGKMGGKQSKSESFSTRKTGFRDLGNHY